MKNILTKIEELKTAIDALRPLDKDTLGRIEQKFRLDWNYHSNAIEGNSLNFGETKSFLLHGITAAGKPLKDHLDLRGHNEAIVALEDIIKEERPITESFIRSLHEVILVEDSYNPAVTESGEATRKKVHIGQYKTANNHVKTSTGEVFYFASVEETPAKMHDLINWLREHKEKENPVILAALFHYKFITIHPFDDGNGRLARILMNFILMRAGFPPVVIKTAEKENYFIALRQADGGDKKAFVEYVAEQLVKSLELYLKGARGESVEELNDVDKEFELFKMELTDLENITYLNNSNYIEYFDNWVIPVLSTIISSLSRISELFNRTEFYAITPYNKRLGEMDMDYTIVEARSLDDFLDKMTSIYESIFEEEKLNVSICYDFFKIKIESVEKISYRINFSVLIKDDRFTIASENVYPFENYDFFYKKDSSEQSKYLAKNILKDFMSYVKTIIKETSSVEPFADDLPF